MKQKHILFISFLLTFLSTISISAQKIFADSKIEQTVNMIDIAQKNTFLTEEGKLPLLSSLADQFLDLAEQEENKTHFIRFFRAILKNINSSQEHYATDMCFKLDRYLQTLFGDSSTNDILHINPSLSPFFIGAIKTFFKKYLEIINNPEVTKDQTKRMFWINLICDCIIESVEK